MSKDSKLRRNKTRDMVYVSMFAVLIAICSWICIPTAPPFTMQTFGVFVTVSVLGGKRGSLAVFIYLLLGAIGIPVFSGFTGGLGILFGNNGGYIAGFLLAALFMWVMESCFGTKKWILACSMFLGLFICYAFGTCWFMTLYAKNVGEVGLLTALGWCVFPFVIPDFIKIILALLFCKKIKKVIHIN